MKEIVIISGKGGTGKTSITASFAALTEGKAVFADCDVDAADLHLVLEPDVKTVNDFSGGSVASIITDKCIGCGKCAELCRFDAISFDGEANDIVGKTYRITKHSCEGCKVCVEFCPTEAIEFKPAINGQWFESQTRFGSMVHAKLGIAEENSGKLVALIRRQAKQLANEQKKDILLIDGSPGIGCPVIASITGADLVVIVTEPTISGKHDLERVAQLAAGFGIKTLVCINKADINPDMCRNIAEQAEKNGLKVIGEVPYDDDFTKAQIQKKALVELEGSLLADKIKDMWQLVLEQL